MSSPASEQPDFKPVTGRMPQALEEEQAARVLAEAEERQAEIEADLRGDKTE